MQFIQTRPVNLSYWRLEYYYEEQYLVCLEDLLNGFHIEHELDRLDSLLYMH
jgi:hypothetical protein